MAKSKTPGFEALAQETALYPQEKLAKLGKEWKSFFIGIPKEVAYDENRVSLTPEAVQLIMNNGHEVWMETGAGDKAKFTDREFSDAGAKIVYSAKEVYTADVILKIEPPTIDEIGMMKSGQVIISALQIGNQTKQFIQALLAKKVTALAYEFIEDKVGGYPIIRALSEIAGNAAVNLASQLLSTDNQGKGILLGGITGVPPTNMLVLGAGTVAENATRS